LAGTKFLFSCLLLWLTGAGPAVSQPADPTLTNAIDVLALPADRALSGIPVSVRGVVTAAMPDWEGRFFVQDASAGVFVENISDQQPAPGDFVQVSGVSAPGGFAPIITRPLWHKLGTAPLPDAHPVRIEQLMAGIEDSQRVEISGIVRTVRLANEVAVFEIVSGGYRLSVYTPSSSGVDGEHLVGATVRVRGTAATSFNGQLRHLITVALYVPFPSDFIVEKTEGGDPFERPVIPLNSVAQYRRDRSPDKRIHVKGVVTYQRPGEDLFLQDDSGGLQVKTSQTNVFSPGDVVEAVGFQSFEHFLPVLQDARVRKTGRPRSVVVPRPVTLEELQNGFHQAALITLEGKLLDSTVRRIGQGTDHLNQPRPILTLQNTNFLFTAEGPSAGTDTDLAAIPVGTTLAVSGVCLMHIREDGKMQSLQILLAGPQSVRILQTPSWWTARRLLVGVGVLGAVLIVAVSWTLMVSRKNADLKKARDQLELRVEERTKQLKVEMTARKESEVQFKATLAERTRLAQELHDTLEQSLTGIGLQLDTAVKLFRREPEGASRHLGLARNLMTQSQVELRRSIWDLRSRELEQFDLANALLATGRQITDGTNIQLQVDTQGTTRVLSEVIEENLLRIGQEAVTNIIKHSGAHHAKIELEFRPETVVLRVEDDGVGFTPHQRPGSGDGHFGLLGISERAKRLNGRIQLDSAPGQGTRLVAEIPTGAALNADPGNAVEHEI
jgi:signal transduction histidine kinase